MGTAAQSPGRDKLPPTEASVGPKKDATEFASRVSFSLRIG